MQNRGTARPGAAKVQVSLAGRPYAVGNDDFGGSLELAVTGGLPESISCSAATRYVPVPMSLTPMSLTGKPGEQFDVPSQKYELGKGEQSKVYFRVRLIKNAPSAAQGRLVRVMVPLQADQLPPS